MLNITKDRLQERLVELRSAEKDALAQVHAIQGAIMEIEQFWLPFLDEQEQTAGESKAAPIPGGAA